MSVLGYRMESSQQALALQSRQDPLAAKSDLINLYRAKMLSDEALQKRIYKFRKCNKLELFIQVTIHIDPA